MRLNAHFSNDDFMKTTITAFLLFFFFGIGISQNLFFEIRGKHTRGVSLEKLNTAKTMMDIRTGYPSSMIDSYTSTEITVTTNGKVMKATGVNETLSMEQQNLLQTADVGSDIAVEIGYVHQNPVTLFPDIRHMEFVMAVVPEVEAAYPGGYPELMMYLEKNAIDKITESFPKETRGVVIKFIVTETGKITNAQISESSTDPQIDKLLLETITNMPDWKPAENTEGVKIPQEFEFAVGNGC